VTRLVGLLGSVTPPGRLSGALESALARAAARGHETRFLDLGALTLGYADGRPLDQLGDDSPLLVQAIRDAEAVVLATPVYRGTLTGALKNALDLLPLEALQAKPVGIIAMGATLHHYLGVESHLRDILSWFGAITLPTGVYLSSADFVEGAVSENAAAALDALIEAATSFAAVVPSLGTGPGPLASAGAKRG